jgi:calcineurin-like phosphoesterase family protein
MILKIKEEKKVWITSDTHYSHKNICRGVTDWRLEDGSIPINQTRDFKTLDQMNDAIVNNINNLVGQDDVLIHLGDWSFGGFQNVKLFRDRIFCKEIHLILGNHDHHIESNREGCQKYFASVSRSATLEYLGHTIEILHYPMSSWNGLNKGRLHLHGHCHLSNEDKFGKGRRQDVGIDGHPKMSPYDLMTEVVTPLYERPILSDMWNDHHTDNLKGVVG